jgi:ABC-2 type transport system permease protein
MIRKVYVPKYIYPFSGVLSNFVIFIISLVVLFGVMIFFLATGNYHAPMNWHMFMSVIPLLNLFVLALGMGMILATLCVFFRDVEYLWSVMLMLIMYCSAIFYFVDQMGAGARRLIKINPLFGIINNFRRSFFGQPFDKVLLLYTSVVAVFTLVVGLIAFYKKQDSFILHI